LIFNQTGIGLAAKLPMATCEKINLCSTLHTDYFILLRPNIKNMITWFCQGSGKFVGLDWANYRTITCCKFKNKTTEYSKFCSRPQLQQDTLVDFLRHFECCISCLLHNAVKTKLAGWDTNQNFIFQDIIPGLRLLGFLINGRQSLKFSKKKKKKKKISGFYGAL